MGKTGQSQTRMGSGLHGHVTVLNPPGTGNFPQARRRTPCYMHSTTIKNTERTTGFALDAQPQDRAGPTGCVPRYRAAEPPVTTGREGACCARPRGSAPGPGARQKPPPRTSAQPSIRKIMQPEEIFLCVIPTV